MTTSTPSTTTRSGRGEQAAASATPSTPAAPVPRTPADHALPLPRLFDWLQAEVLALPRIGGSVQEHAMRSEQYVEDGRFVLRVELPGVDPDKDVDITVADGVLTVHAERHESRRDGKHSEFHYGKIVRTFLLPHGADEQAAAATYRDGVLEVTVPVPTYDKGSGRKVPVTRAQA